MMSISTPLTRTSLKPLSWWLSVVNTRGISTTMNLFKNVAGRYSPTPKRDFPLTYEMSQRPFLIGITKYWNSINESGFVNVYDTNYDPPYDNWSLRSSETLLEDVFIRKFVSGTWHRLFVSEIVIKRNANLIRVTGIVQRSIPARKMYFLIGYTEELLSYWIQCPVKMELQTVDSKKDVIYKYI